MPEKTATTGNFQCPVCRARQVLQSQCRRCDADLSLVVAAHERIAYLLTEQVRLENSELEHKRITDELRLLAPRWIN